jgi:hypothetical protein
MRQHRWEKLLDHPGHKELLWEAKTALKSAWMRDQRDPKSYPIDTIWTLSRIQALLKSRLPTTISGPIRARKKPRTLRDLLPDETMERLWVDHHSETFQDGIRAATPGKFESSEQWNEEIRRSWKAFQKLLHIMKQTWLLEYMGWEFLRRPKVNILHIGLHDISKAAGLGDQNREGFAEFLDDLCPCGLKSHNEALRALGKRSANIRRGRG